jgi:hypothetical protein
MYLEISCIQWIPDILSLGVKWLDKCLDALSELAGLNEVTLVWVPGHCGIFGKEEVDKLARQASAKPLLGPEPALGIPRCLTREAIKNWTEYEHYSVWKNLPGQRHGKLFIGKPCRKGQTTCSN